MLYAWVNSWLLLGCLPSDQLGLGLGLGFEASIRVRVGAHASTAHSTFTPETG